MTTLNIAVVGLGFGVDFLPIYQSHPQVGKVGICDRDADRLRDVGEAFGIQDRHTDLDEVLCREDYDAVHLLTPVAWHRQQVLQILAAGKHVASAVPMGRSIEDLDSILAAQQRSGKNYMMMETAVYGREFFFVEDLIARGQLGEITFLRGTHIQDLDGFPSYWWGYPPMLYATHALSPLLALCGQTVSSVRCLGSGRLPPELMHDYDNPFPLEAALFRLGDGELAAEVTASFHRVARSFHEGFSIYGTRSGFEWQQLEHEQPTLFELGPAPEHRRGGLTAEHRVALPDRHDTLPAQIRRFTQATDYAPGTGRTIRTPAYHSGSHPHLAHEFVSSVIEGRRPAVDAITAAQWCAPGICAHHSAMQGGEAVEVPRYHDAC